MSKSGTTARRNGTRTNFTTTEVAAADAEADENDTTEASPRIQSPLSRSIGAWAAGRRSHHGQHSTPNKNKNNRDQRSSFSASSSWDEEASEEGRISSPTKSPSAATQSTVATSLSDRTAQGRNTVGEIIETVEDPQQRPHPTKSSSSNHHPNSNRGRNNGGLRDSAQSYGNDRHQETITSPPAAELPHTFVRRKTPVSSGTAASVETSTAIVNEATTLVALAEPEVVEEDPPSIFDLFERRRQSRRGTPRPPPLPPQPPPGPTPPGTAAATIRSDGSFTLADSPPKHPESRPRQHRQPPVALEEHPSRHPASSVLSATRNGNPSQHQTNEDNTEHHSDRREENSWETSPNRIRADPFQRAPENDAKQHQQHQQHQQQQQQQQNSPHQRDIHPPRRPVRSTRLDQPASSLPSPATVATFSTASSHRSSRPHQPPPPPRRIRSRSREIPKSDHSGSSAGAVLPGAYPQAPGRTTTHRNRNIRNSVISTHSMSARMSGSTTRVTGGASGRSLLSARSSGGSVSTMSASNRSHNSFPTVDRGGERGRRANRRGERNREDDDDVRHGDDNDEDEDDDTDFDADEEGEYSSGKFSSSGKRRARQERRQRRRRPRKQKSSAEDFYETMPDYVDTVQEAPNESSEQVTTLAVSEVIVDATGRDGDLDSEEFMYQRKLAASMADLDVDMSLDENIVATNDSDDLSRLSSSRRHSRESKSKTVLRQRSSVGQIETPVDSILFKEESSTSKPSIPGKSLDFSIDKNANSESKACLQSALAKSDPADAMAPPASVSRACDSKRNNEEQEEAKEEIEALEEQDETVAPLQRMPWRDQSRSLLNRYPSSRSQRMQHSTGGSNHSMNLSRLNSTATFNLGKTSFVSNGSSSELSMTEFRRRVSSMYSSSSSDEDASIAREMSIRIAQNMSMHMRTVGLPVAATVVSSEEALRNEIRQELESEMGEALKREIRLELEVEMAEFRRQLFRQVMNAAEPVTAQVISVERNGLENSQLASFREAQVERERTEAAAVRTNMHREIGRMYMEMKRGQSANFSNAGNNSIYSMNPIDENNVAVYDEETAQPVIKTKEASSTTWGSIWFVFVLAVISGFALGVGVSKFL